MTTKSFDSYTITIYGGSEGRVGMLMCYAANAFVGRIDFYPDGVPLPPDYLWHPNPVGEYIVLFIPMSRFEVVLATARNEKPLNLYIDVSREIGAMTKGHGYLSTSDKEPVGEAEV